MNTKACPAQQMCRVQPQNKSPHDVSLNANCIMTNPFALCLCWNGLVYSILEFRKKGARFYWIDTQMLQTCAPIHSHLLAMRNKKSMLYCVVRLVLSCSVQNRPLKFFANEIEFLFWCVAYLTTTTKNCAEKKETRWLWCRHANDISKQWDQWYQRKNIFFFLAIAYMLIVLFRICRWLRMFIWRVCGLTALNARIEAPAFDDRTMFPK